MLLLLLLLVLLVLLVVLVLLLLLLLEKVELPCWIKRRAAPSFAAPHFAGFAAPSSAASSSMEHAAPPRLRRRHSWPALLEEVQRK